MSWKSSPPKKEYKCAIPLKKIHGSPVLVINYSAQLEWFIIQGKIKTFTEIYFHFLYHLQWTCGEAVKEKSYLRNSVWFFHKNNVSFTVKQSIVWEFQTEETSALKILFNF